MIEEEMSAARPPELRAFGQLRGGDRMPALGYGPPVPVFLPLSSIFPQEEKIPPDAGMRDSFPPRQQLGEVSTKLTGRQPTKATRQSF